MKLSVTAFAALAAILPVSLADFDLYTVQEHDRVSGEVTSGWYIFDGEPSCADVTGNNNVLYIRKDDVSGDKTGVRCEGGGCFGGEPPENVDVLEMNFHSEDPVYHWTIYKDRGWTMYGLDGNAYGECQPFSGDTFSCESGTGWLMDGVRKFHCKTARTAAEIKSTRG